MPIQKHKGRKRACACLPSAVCMGKFLSFRWRLLCSIANCLCGGALPAYIPFTGSLWFLSFQFPRFEIGLS